MSLVKLLAKPARILRFKSWIEARDEWRSPCDMMSMVALIYPDAEGRQGQVIPEPAAEAIARAIHRQLPMAVELQPELDEPNL